MTILVHCTQTVADRIRIDPPPCPAILGQMSVNFVNSPQIPGPVGMARDLLLHRTSAFGGMQEREDERHGTRSSGLGGVFQP